MTVLPLTPGGLGIVELGLTAPLIAGLGSGGSARVAAAVLLYRALTYLPSLPLGALAFAWWRYSSRRAAVKPEQARAVYGLIGPPAQPLPELRS
jgi:uncharacterized membrane protein YbhN (UPF0104 family)